MEALACGLTIIDYKLNYEQGLPSEHDPKNVVSHLVDIYSRKRNRLFNNIPSVICILLDLVSDIFMIIKLLKNRIDGSMIDDH